MTPAGGAPDHLTAPHAFRLQEPPVSAGDEIMTPVSKPEAIAMAEINAMRLVADTLRVLSDAVTAQGKAQAEQSAASTRAMERLTEKVDGMNSRLIRLEEAKHGREIERLEGSVSALAIRVNDLEGTRDQQRGAKGLVDWLRQTAPWLIGAGLGIAGWFGGRA